MNITRKGFVGALTGGTVLLLLKGCGGGGSDGAYGGGTVLVCGASGIAIAGNHGHVLTILRAELDSLTDKSTPSPAARTTRTPWCSRRCSCSN